MEKQTIDVCLSPVLFPYYYQQGQIVVLVDIFRATSVICTALANGARSVKPLFSIEEARPYKSQGYLLAGERNRQKIEGFDLGNSPKEYKPEVVTGRDIAFTTTNGTQAVEQAREAEQLIVASFLNIDAVSQYLLNQGKPVLILCAGWKNKFCWEDTLFAGMLSQNLIESNRFETGSDSVEFTLKAIEDLMDIKSFLIEKSPQLQEAMPLLYNDVDYCLSKNLIHQVPEFQNGEFILTPERHQ